MCVCACRVCFICRYYCVVSLLAEVSHDEAKWNKRRETSAGFRRVSYHACARVSLTASDVFVTCKTTQRTGLNLSARERLLNLSTRSNYKWTDQSWGWNDLVSGRCRRPHHVHHKSLRKAKKTNFKANFLRFFTSLSTAEAHVFGVKFIGLYGTIRDDNVINLIMKITGKIIFKTTFGCPHDTIIRSKYNIQQITRILMFKFKFLFPRD